MNLFDSLPLGRSNLKIGILLLSLITEFVQAKQEVTISEKEFKNAPKDIVYFPKSDSILLLESVSNKVFYSENEGKTWDDSSLPTEAKIQTLHRHPFDDDRAIALTAGKEHYATKDKGKTWSKFSTSLEPVSKSDVFSFNSGRPGYVIYHGADCKGSKTSSVCQDDSFYTTDFFSTPPKPLLKEVTKCIWGRSSQLITDMPTKMVFCIKSADGTSGLKKMAESQLVRSKDFFDSSKDYIDFDFDGVPDKGVIGISVSQKYLIAVARQDQTSEHLRLFISQDGKVWAQAHIPGHEELLNDSYVVLDSTKNSLALAVGTSSDSKFDTLYFSNSNGTYFTQSLTALDMDSSGFAKTERVKGLEHTIISNIVRNADSLNSGGVFSSKEVQTKISFNNGGNWAFLPPPDKDCQGKTYACVDKKDSREKCSLHLQLTQTHRSDGSLFSRASSPGFLIGTGSVGDSLKGHDELDTFFSKDGGISWKCVRPSPHKYVLADMGSLIVLINDKDSTNNVIYSYDQGSHWNEGNLPMKIKPLHLATEKSSTSQSTLLFGKKDSGEYVTLHLDFSGFHSRKCEFDKKNPSSSKDFELWKPKTLGSDGVSTESCIMGHKLGYFRKKPNSECYIGEKFSLPETEKEDCPCGDEDYECDYNFIRNDKHECVPDGPELFSHKVCKNEKTFTGSSGYRKIPENTCSSDANGAKVLDKPVEKPCEKTNAPVLSSNGIRHNRKELSDSNVKVYNFPESESYVIWGKQGLWSSQDSGYNWKLSIKDHILKVIGHKYDNKTLYVLTQGKTGQVTNDQGTSFREFTLPTSISKSSTDLAFKFNYRDKKHIILQENPKEPHSNAYLSTDGGNSWVSLAENTNKCIFASTEEFSASEDNVLCSRLKSNSKSDHELVLLDFKGKTVKQLSDHVDQFNIVGPHLFVASFKDNQTLFISDKTLSLSPIDFPPDVILTKNGYVIHDSPDSHSGTIYLTTLTLPSTGSSPVTFGNTQTSIGSFYISNSNGTSYSLSLPDIEVKDSGLVALQEVEGIRGISIANQLLDVNHNYHRVQSSISFDNGASWNQIPAPLKMINGSDYNCKNLECSLHLQLFQEDTHTLMPFGLKNGAGKVLAVGSVGSDLKYKESRKTYFSQDAGMTWTEILNSHSVYALGDSGNLMVLVDEFPTTTLLYSTDGVKMEKYAFSDDPIWVNDILTSSSGDSLQFLIVGYGLSKSDPSDHHSEVIAVDFSKLFSRKCVFDKTNTEDFEKWSPSRLYSDKKGIQTTECLLGQKITHWRKKPSKNCYVGQNSKSQKVTFETCSCTVLDYECDTNYQRSDFGHGDCVLVGRDPERPDHCPLGTNYTASSGYRRNPSSSCNGGVDLTAKIQKPCHEVAGIDVKQTVFDSKLGQYFYFRNSTALLVRLLDGSVKISRNEGYSFHDLLDKNHPKIMEMFHHSYIDDTAILMSKTTTHYITHNEGRTHTSFTTPLAPNTLQITHFTFHPNDASWFIFIGEEGCDKIGQNCYTKAFETRDSGQTWSEIGSYVRQCSFAWTPHFQKGPEDRIFCEMYAQQSGSQNRFSNVNLALKYSDDGFASSHTVLENMIHFAVFYEYMVVATPSDDKSSIVIQVSTDGENFSPAKYPPEFTLTHDSFTVAESDTHSIVLHLTTNSHSGQEMGPLLVSNTNGTLFSLSLDNVNRNTDGLIDYEKMAGVEGIALVNQVINPKDVKLASSKKIVSKITFDNGASWITMRVKGKDSLGKDFSCKGSNCNLNLHSFTERSDPENIFSSPAAVGMMIGTGNYGETLGGYTFSDTFFTNNAGKDWFEIKKGPHRHEFGDSGGIILLVADGPNVDEILFSQDMGLTFKPFKFGLDLEKIRVLETSVEPQSTSQKLLVLGYTKNDNKFAITYFDFTGLNERKCKYDPNDIANSDFELWSPSPSRDSTCLFGREVQYLRRKRDQKCTIDRKFEDPIKKVTNCTCTRQDFECDFNFALDSSGNCVLIPGLEPPQTSCKNGEEAFTRSTGYRKLPYSTCQGGKDLSHSKEIWCPGRGLSGWSIAFMVILPLSGLGLLLYAFIRRGTHRPIPWDTIFQYMLPCLCFFPAMVVSCMYGQGQHFFARLRNSFNRMQGYAPVSQYDYDLDEDYIDGPVEVQLEDYDQNHLDLDDFDGVEDANYEQSRLV